MGLFFEWDESNALENLRFKEIISDIKSRKRPLIIGVSGFGGAGKSSFSNELGKLLDTPVISVDSFMRDRTLQEYSLWEVMDFTRLTSEVIKPFLSGANPVSYGHFDWGINGIKFTKEAKHHGVIIIEGVGLLRPELNQYFGYKVWVDCPVDEATRRGKKRDQVEYQNPQSESWDGIWKKNDAEYFETYKPKEVADLVFNNCRFRLE